MKSPRARVVICGYYGFGNSGDELILAAMLRELRSLRPGLAATVISGDPESTRGAHGVGAVHWQDVPAIAAEVANADLVLVGGGGLFQEYSGIDPDSLFTARHYAITYYAEPAILGALRGRPVMLYAVGVGPLLSEHGRRSVRAACDAAQVITLRDEDSARIVASLGIDPARLRVTADPVFALPVASHASQPDVLAATLPPGPGALVGVALRHWDVGVASYFWEKEVAAGLDAFLATHEARLLFVPFQRLARAPENDTAVAERVRSLLRDPARATVLRGDGDPAALGAILGRCDLVVGMRLHAMILAAISGVPGVALSYDPKVELAMRQIGAEPFVVRLPDIEARTLASRMEQALGESQARRKDLGERVARLAELARSNAVAAIDLLDRPPAALSLTPALAEMAARAVAGRFEAEAVLRGEVAALREETVGLREEKHRAETAVAERERARVAAEAAVESTSKELHQAREELSARDGKLARANIAIEQRDAELRQVRGDLEARGAELQQLHASLLAASAELERVRAAFAAETTVVRQVRAELATETTRLRQSQTDLAARSAELEEVRSELASESEELDQTLDELSLQDEALERSRAEVSRFRDRVASLEGELLRIHQSRLWKLATRYWRFLEAIGRLPGSRG